MGKKIKIYLEKIKNEAIIKKLEKEFSNIDKKLNRNINNNNNSLNKDNISKFDISNQITPKLLKDINKGNWNQKKEAIDYIHKMLILSNNNISSDNLKDLFNIIKDKLKDGNKNLVKLILELLYHLIESIGKDINKYADYYMLPLLSNLSDKNINIREECLKCIKKLIELINFKIFCYHFPQLIINENNNEMKNSILDLLIENSHLINKNYRENFFNELINSLLICLQDRNQLIRNKAEEFIKKFELLNKEDYIKRANEFKPEKAKSLINNINLIFKENNSSNISDIESPQSNKIENKNNSINKRINGSLNNKIRKLNNSASIRKNKNGVNISLDYTEYNRNKNKKLNNEIFLKTEKSINKKNKTFFNSFAGYTTSSKVNKKISFFNENKIKNNKEKIINLKCNNISFVKSIPKKNMKNHKLPLSTESNNKKIQIFLGDYKANKESKEKRLETDKRNNFLFEIHNFLYLSKIKEFSKEIFTPEFYEKLFSYDLNDMIFCINKINKFVEKNNKLNSNLEKIIENIDIILKIIGYVFYSNQSSSLTKIFFEFIKSYINVYEKNKINFTEIESNILLNIFCDKLINSNNSLANYAQELIIKISHLIGINKTFAMMTNLIKYKNSKLKDKIIELILKLYNEENIDNNILSKSIKNILNIYFESDLNIKNKIILLLRKIYKKFGEIYFDDYLKSFPPQQKEEILKNILNEEINNKLKEKPLIKNIYIGKKYPNSAQKRKINKNYNGNTLQNSININKNIYSIRKNKNNSLLNKTINNNYITQNNSRDKIKHHAKNNIYNTTNLKNKHNKNIFINEKKENQLNNSAFNRKVKKNKINNLKKNLINTYNQFYSNTNNNNSINLKLNESININENKNLLTKEKLEEVLISLLNTAKSKESKIKMEYIINIHDLIYSNYSLNKIIINDNIDFIINLLIKSTKLYLENISEDITSLKYLTNTFSLICNLKDLLMNISYEIEEQLVDLIFYVILLKNLKEMGKNKEGLIIWKSFNSMMLKIIEFCNPSNTINILIEKIINNNNNDLKYNEYCSRCLMIINHKKKDIFNKVNIPELLFEINKFLIYYNINEEKLKSKDINDIISFSEIRKMISLIVTIKKEKIYEDYNYFINKSMNGQEGAIKNNLIKLLIDENFQ